MSKKLIILVLIALCAIPFSARHENGKDVNTFKVEQIGVKM